jgi:DNA-binding NarL/FixJ family response regulator
MVRCGFAVALGTLHGVAGKPDIVSRPAAGFGAASESVSPRVRTLVVDDSEAVRDGLTRLLASREYCELVGAVSDPAAALDLARTTHPHVVLQDYSMPGVDPIALVRELSACRPRPAVLMLSAFADAPSERQAVDAGAIGWVLKDAEPEQLFAALLGAAGPVATAAPAATGESGFAVATPLDARTVRALLRALEADPAGLTIGALASLAVLSVPTATRYIHRLTMRHPGLVAQVTPRSYALTGAGQAELERLERRIPEARGGHHAAPPLVRYR